MLLLDSATAAAAYLNHAPIQNKFIHVEGNARDDASCETEAQVRLVWPYHW